MANLARNSITTGNNLSRSGIETHSRIWDENNTPWSPDDTLPWQDNTTEVEFNVSGSPLSRNSTPASTNLTRN